MADSTPNRNTPRPVTVGDQLGQFKLVELIAVGGMGLVYRANDLALNRYVAVKVLAPELAADAAVAARFLEESRSAAALNHVNVVHIYSAGEQAGLYYFVMELVNGQHLEALLNSRAPLPLPAAIDLIRQAALGLQHAHDHGLIHGDVKPANFLVSEAGVVKVTDFGLARHVKSATATTAGESLFGTPGYVSPEVIHGQPPDHRSDIYSLGATFFHALAGRPPFVGVTPEDTLRRQTRDPAPPIQKYNDSVPPAIGQVIARMLATDPAARYPSYAALHEALTRPPAETPAKPATRSRPHLATGTPPQAPPKPVPVKKESWFTVIFTLLALVASIVTLILIYRNKLSPSAPPPPQGSTISSNRPPPVAVNLNTEAEQAFVALKPEVAAAVAARNWGKALEISEKWSTVKYGNTPTYLVVVATRKQIRDQAAQAWADQRPRIAALTTAEKFPEARALLTQLEPTYRGCAEILDQLTKARTTLEDAEHDAETKHATEKAAAQAQLDRIEKLRGQVGTYITGYQWDKALEEIQKTVTEIGAEAEITKPLTVLQSELTSLIALRTGLAARVKAKPSALVTLTTKTGELQAHVTGMDGTNLNLQQVLGTVGFAETTVAWTDLTPASACRVLMLNLDPNNADELFGYTVLLTHQALAKQARIEDARKTLQVLAQRAPARAAWVEQSLARLAELEPKLVSPPDPAPPSTTPEQPRAVELPIARAFSPLDISSACNASFYLHGDHGRRSDEFSRHTYIGELPNDGLVPLRGVDAGGAFQLRTSDKPDSIGITWSTGRFPNTATIKLPPGQQRRYARLAILSAASVGDAIVKAQFTYDNGATTEAKLRIYEWSSTKPPDAAQSALNLPIPESRRSRRLYLDLIDLDAQRRLTSISFAWVSTKTENPLHCVGIFAISGLPAVLGR